MKDAQLLPLSERPEGFPLRVYRALKLLRCSGCQTPIVPGEQLTRSADRAAMKPGYAYTHCVTCQPLPACRPPVPAASPRRPAPAPRKVAAPADLWVVLRKKKRASWGAVVVRGGQVVASGGGPLEFSSKLGNALQAAWQWAQSHRPARACVVMAVSRRRKPPLLVVVMPGTHRYFKAAQKAAVSNAVRPPAARQEAPRTAAPAVDLARPPKPPAPPPAPADILVYADYSGSETPRAFAWGAVFQDQATGLSLEASGPLTTGGEPQAVLAALAWLEAVCPGVRATVYNDGLDAHHAGPTQGLDVRYQPRSAPMIVRAHDLAREMRARMLQWQAAGPAAPVLLRQEVSLRSD
ncbi:hypothetical protein [Deinococcus navajonensis]|uniref:Uncharacterized protein n=1 Tax=Deinococcus navajonensis TaxID=309884 RepID=A0ABV8XH07_9DEIO